MQERQKKYSAPALEKGLDIIELLSGEEQGLALSEISRALGRSVGEIFRMLVVLNERGYVAQDPDTDRYVLTTLLFEIAHRTPLIKRLTALAGDQMRALARAVNQTVHLAVISKDAVLVVGQVDSPGDNILSVRLGARFDPWRASSGRVILAFTPEEDLAALVRRAPPPDGRSEADLRTELAAIRERGHEIRESFVLRGIVNISAPIIDHTGRAVAAMTVPHLKRYDDVVSFEACCEALLATAEGLSRRIGGGVATPLSARG